MKTIKEETRALYPKVKNGNRISPETVDSTTSENLELRWKDLTYIIESRRRDNKFPFHSRLSINVVLKCLSGGVRSGLLMGIMGPSGCGKSTLLQCISGQRKKGLTGEIFCSKGCQTKAAFLTQEDHLLGQLTVRESLVFASKCKNKLNHGDNHQTSEQIEPIQPIVTIETPANHSRSTVSSSLNHSLLVDTILEQLGLLECSQVKVNSCSGGQRKRISIASELISKPDLLILDEPTSGLDSSSCFQCIRLLNSLTRGSNHHQPLAIIASIHQPSARVLSNFNQLYILSKDGQCIYNGPPELLVESLTKIGLPCPHFHNPADFISEIAYGDYGHEPIMKLVSGQREVERRGYGFDETPATVTGAKSSLLKGCHVHNSRFIYHTWILLHRTFLITAREPLLTTMRLITFLIVGFSVSLLFGPDIGRASGCKINFYGQPNVPDDSLQVNENVSYIFFTLLFMLFTAMMPTVLTFPLEMSVFLKEHTNGWYSCSAYYIAKFLADTPFQVIFPSLYCAISYFATHQILSTWRFSLFLAICCLLSMLAQSIGLLIGAIFVRNLNGAVFIAPITVIPVLLFSGFFVRISIMPSYLKPFSYCSYMRFAFEALIAVIYGFGRCDDNDKPRFRQMHEREESRSIRIDGTDWKSINKEPFAGSSQLHGEMANYQVDRSLFKPKVISYVMEQFDVDDSVVAENCIILIAFILLIRAVSFVIFLYKAKRKDQNL